MHLYLLLKEEAFIKWEKKYIFQSLRGKFKTHRANGVKLVTYFCDNINIIA